MPANGLVMPIPPIWTLGEHYRQNNIANLTPSAPVMPWAVTHSAYSRLRLTEPAGETAAILAELVPLQHDADLPTIEAFAFVLEQLRAAGIAVEQASANGRRDKLLRLSQDAQGSANVALRYARELGLTPRSRAELGVDLARVRSAAARFDPTRLSDDERRQLETLLDKGTPDADLPKRRGRPPVSAGATSSTPCLLCVRLRLQSLVERPFFEILRLDTFGTFRLRPR